MNDAVANERPLGPKADLTADRKPARFRNPGVTLKENDLGLFA